MYPNNGRDEEQVECKEQQKSGLKLTNFNLHKPQDLNAYQRDNESSDSCKRHFVGKVVDSEIKHKIKYNSFIVILSHQIHLSLGFDVLVGLYSQDTVHNLMLIQILDGIFGTLRVMVFHDCCCQSSPEIVLLDEAFLQGSFCCKEFLASYLSYIKIVIGELGTESHHLESAEELLPFLLLLNCWPRTLFLEVPLVPVVPGISVVPSIATIIFKTLFDRPILVRCIISWPPITSILIIDGTGSTHKFFCFEFLGERGYTCLSLSTLFFVLSFLMRSSRDTSAIFRSNLINTNLHF